LSLQFDLDSTTVEDVDLALRRAEEAQLQTALDVYIAQSILEEPIGVVSLVDVHLAGISPTPLPVAVVVGLFVGLLIGVAGLIIVDRVRQPLWETKELEPRYRLPEVAARPRKLGDSAKPWYSTAPQGRRKADVQQLRSAVEGLPGFGDGVVVGVASVTGSSPHAHELAADLAAGLTFSGSWALLIDTDYGQPSDLAEYRNHNFELEDVVADPQGTLGEAVRRADRDRDFIGVSIRKSSADAADLLAQPAFARMLDTAQAMHDAVIVASPPTDSASYHVLSQRLDAMILVAIAGDPVPADVVNALHTLEERRSVPAGVVLIRPRIGPLSLIMNRIDRPPPTSDPAGPHQGDWQWSKGQDAKSKSVSTTHQDPDSAAPGNDSGEFPTDVASTEPAWQYSEISRSGDGAPTVASNPSSEQGDVERDIAELAQGTRRIKRRGSSNGSSDEAETTDSVRSPWSLRHRGA
jgi:Mrp family chromosome partitioning ATPase